MNFTKNFGPLWALKPEVTYLKNKLSTKQTVYTINIFLNQLNHLVFHTIKEAILVH